MKRKTNIKTIKSGIRTECYCLDTGRSLGDVIYDQSDNCYFVIICNKIRSKTKSIKDGVSFIEKNYNELQTQGAWQ